MGINLKKWLGRLFGREEVSGGEDVLELARFIESETNKTVNDVFAGYTRTLLQEHITYIVPAVWGANKAGPLSPTQKKIAQKVAPALRRILETFQPQNLSPAQEFALGYLIRGLIIAKTTYMIEALRPGKGERPGSPEPYSDLLARLKPQGHA